MHQKHNIDDSGMHNMQQAQILVDGIVQGVGFRYMIRMEAKMCGLKGHIRNREDGTVEIVCEGKKESIESLIDRIKRVQSPMHVDDIQVEYSDATGRFKTFKIISNDLGEEMIEGFSTGYMYLNRIDTKQDQMLEKQDQTVSEIRTLSQSVNDMLDSRFQKLEDEISKIKAKLEI